MYFGCVWVGVPCTGTLHVVAAITVVACRPQVRSVGRGRFVCVFVNKTATFIYMQMYTSCSVGVAEVPQDSDARDSVLFLLIYRSRRRPGVRSTVHWTLSGAAGDVVSFRLKPRSLTLRDLVNDQRTFRACMFGHNRQKTQ